MILLEHLLFMFSFLCSISRTLFVPLSFCLFVFWLMASDYHFGIQTIMCSHRPTDYDILAWNQFCFCTTMFLIDSLSSLVRAHAIVTFCHNSCSLPVTGAIVSLFITNTMQLSIENIKKQQRIIFLYCYYITSIGQYFCLFSPYSVVYWGWL